MREIVSVKLENDMDLILAHKKVMKLGELTGFSLIAQTSLATAVSEIARCAIEFGKNAVLKLSIETAAARKFINATIQDTEDFSAKSTAAVNYARKLVGDISLERKGKEIKFILQQQLSLPGTFSEARIESILEYFKIEPPLSPYEELRRKNLLLQEFADKIKESESDYKILSESLPVMMFMINTRGQITYTNKWVENFLGTLPKEISAATWQNFLHPVDYSLFSKSLAKAIQTFTPLKSEYRLKEKSTGNFLWHMISILPLKNDKDIVTAWIGFMVDIDAQKKVDQTIRDNQQLKQMQEDLVSNQEELQGKIIELNRSNYELEQFAHLATHDLQEPLRKLFFYSDLLKNKYQDKIDAGGVSLLNNMTSAAGRMKELITDLLNYSRLHQQTMDLDTVDLNDLMHGIVKDLEISFKEKSATIEIETLPALRGNELRLRQLFSNLVSNALKYSRKEITPRIEISTSTENNFAVIKVRDNGIGFEEEHQERIFGLFERLHTRDEIPGTGIGLSICRKIVELHHGTISATSIPGDHSVFIVSLPLG